jgi:hypothetical protein
MAAVIARMVALDGLPFRVFCTSTDLRNCLRMKVCSDIPKSPNTIKKIVIEYSENIRTSVIAELNFLTKKKVRFSLTLDEWTSSRNRRYMNVNVHGPQHIWNLGLLRINGRFASEDCVILLEKMLQSFHLNIQKDISCIVTDGASMMQRVGTLLPCEQILCFAHGIQIAVVNIIYKKPVIDTEANIEQDIYNESDSDSEHDEEDIEVDNGMRIEIEINPNEEIESTENFNLRTVIVKIRKIVKMFRRSPLKNEVLQNHVKVDHGKELQLFLDTKTRWNSLVAMLERFELLKTS